MIGEYVHDAEGGRHQAFYSPVRDTTVFGQVIRPHERIQVEESLKWSPEETRKMWDLAGMTEMGKWMHGTEYGEQPAFPFTHITYIPIFRRQLGSARFFLSLSLLTGRSTMILPKLYPTF